MDDKLKDTIVKPLSAEDLSAAKKKTSTKKKKEAAPAKEGASRQKTDKSSASRQKADKGSASRQSTDKDDASRPEANKDTAFLEDTGHVPRPLTPEDESYGEVMLRFTSHPVKPKYWFEEFGDHWTCSCGQINKSETCANCGLERDLLRKLFILHKPSPDGTPPQQSQDSPDGPSLSSSESDNDSEPPVLHPAQEREPAPARTSGKPSRLVAGVLIAVVLLLLGTGAFLYLVVFPEMQEQDAARRDSVRISLVEHLPVATVSLPDAQYNAYIAAGDMLCKKDRYYKSLTYYNKAADLKNDDKVKQKIMDAKFGYVKSHQDNPKEYEYFETFLNEVVEAKYDGAQAIYDRYYAWHVNIIANNIEDDYATDMKTVNKRDRVYFHTTISGGAPNETLTLYYQVIWPDGTSEKKDIESTWHAGSNFSTSFQYPIPPLSKEGKLTFEIYNKYSHALMGSDSIMLKK